MMYPEKARFRVLFPTPRISIEEFQHRNYHCAAFATGVESLKKSENITMYEIGQCFAELPDGSCDTIQDFKRSTNGSTETFAQLIEFQGYCIFTTIIITISFNPITEADVI
jgi:hypothetical protein